MNRILITGASGQLGRLIIKNLFKKLPDAHISGLVRNAAGMEDLIENGLDIRIGDYHQPESLEKAFTGINKLLLISSNDFNNRLRQHQHVVDAAKKAGVQHILYTGVCMANINTSPLKPLLGDHFETEAYIRESGIDFTFLQNTLYADIIPMFLGDQVLETGVIFPTNEGKVAFASRADLAAAIAVVLAGNHYINQSIQLSPSRSYSFFEIAAILSELSGKYIPFINPDPHEYEAKLKEFKLPEHLIMMSTLFAAGMSNNDFNICTNHLNQLLGRPETDLKTFLKDAYQL